MELQCNIPEDERIQIIASVSGEFPINETLEETVIPVKFEENSARIPLEFRDREQVRMFLSEFYTQTIVSDCTIKYHTTEEWNRNPNLIGMKKVIYVYIDKSQKINPDGSITYIPGIKLGNGTSYLIDTPFLNEDIQDWLITHIHDASVHIQPGERDFWNNKLNYIDPSNELLIFTRD